MSDHDGEPVRLIVNVHRSNIRRLEGVAMVNGESETDAVNRALMFYEKICMTPPGRVLTWEGVDGEKYALAILEPDWVGSPPSWWERFLGFFFVRTS